MKKQRKKKQAQQKHQKRKLLIGAGVCIAVVIVVLVLVAARDGAPWASTDLRIRDWHDLHAVSDDMGGSYVLMNDLDSATAGYAEVAGATANGGQGWQPIGTSAARFTGSFDGRGYEIRDLFVDRPRENNVGLFGHLGSEGVIRNLGVVNAAVTGGSGVGALVGWNQKDGTVDESHFSGTVIGSDYVGGLVGRNLGTVSTSRSVGTVTGMSVVGGLVGSNSGMVSNSHFSGDVGGEESIGGLVAHNYGAISNSHVTGSVTGREGIGGLVAWIFLEGTVSNSYYDYHEVLINGGHVITVGALSGEDFEEWLANDKSLDVDERLSQEDGYYVIGSVGDLRELLAFGQDDSLKFRLGGDLDLGDAADFYVPYLAGEFHGNGHRISNLSFSSDSIGQVGLFGHLASGARVSQVGVEDVSISGLRYVGGLVGYSHAGTVSDSYSIGDISGGWHIGGLVGYSHAGAVINSYSSGSTTGDWAVGGLVGANSGGVSSSRSGGSVSGRQGSIGGLVGWNEESGIVINSYSTAAVAGPENVGGLVGWNDGAMTYSYSSGSVTGERFAGGLVGTSLLPDNVQYSYWDVNTSGTEWSDGGIGMTTTMMQRVTTFRAAHWHIIAVSPGETEPAFTWNIIEGETYPFLSWEPTV